MDVVVAIQPADRLAVTLLAAIASVVDLPATVVNSTAEVELSLRARARDALIADPDVVGLTPVSGVLGQSPVALVGWLPVRSSRRTAELLDAGVEDVLDASMDEVELAARVRRVLGRRPVQVQPRPLEISGLRVDARLREATWQGDGLSLTPREIEVLQVLVAAGGAAVSREVIYRQVWKWAMPRGDRTVDVNIRRLRAKFAAAAVPVEVLTQPGIGYRVVVGDSEAAVTGL